MTDKWGIPRQREGGKSHSVTYPLNSPRFHLQDTRISPVRQNITKPAHAKETHKARTKTPTGQLVHTKLQRGMTFVVLTNQAGARDGCRRDTARLRDRVDTLNQRHTGLHMQTREERQWVSKGARTVQATDTCRETKYIFAGVRSKN